MVPEMNGNEEGAEHDWQWEQAGGFVPDHIETRSQNTEDQAKNTQGTRC